jgi:hypothetical protein
LYSLDYRFQSRRKEIFCQDTFYRTDQIRCAKIKRKTIYLAFSVNICQFFEFRFFQKLYLHTFQKVGMYRSYVERRLSIVKEKLFHKLSKKNGLVHICSHFNLNFLCVHMCYACDYKCLMLLCCRGSNPGSFDFSFIFSPIVR